MSQFVKINGVPNLSSKNGKPSGQFCRLTLIAVLVVTEAQKAITVQYSPV